MQYFRMELMINVEGLVLCLMYILFLLQFSDIVKFLILAIACFNRLHFSHRFCLSRSQRTVLIRFLFSEQLLYVDTVQCL